MPYKEKDNWDDDDTCNCRHPECTTCFPPKMNLKRYRALSARTESDKFDPVALKPSTAHGIIGCATEANELLDALKIAMFYGRKPDLANVREEVGDIMWYIMTICRSEGWELEEILQENIDKLKKRYPEKFTSGHSKARLDKE